MLDHFLQFAAYNQWANERLYNAAADLSDTQYRQDVGIFFKSLEGTLNHILVADQIWMHRLTGKGAPPKTLDEPLFDAFEPLHNARKAADQRIIDYVSTLTPDDLETEFTYKPVTMPHPVTHTVGPVLSHIFNHQTHHRGHAHGALSILGAEPPALDLLYFQLEQRQSR